MFLAGVSESIGIITLLPLLGLLNKSEQVAENDLSGRVESYFHLFNIEPSLEVLLTIIFFGITLKSALRVLAYRQAGYAVSKYTNELRMQIIRALMSARWTYFVKQPAGVLANSMSYEVERAGSTYTSAIKLVSAIFQASIYCVLAVFVSWHITAAAILLGIILMYILNVFIKTTRQSAKKQKSVLKKVVSHLTDALGSLKSLKAMGKEKQLLPYFQEETHHLYEARQKEFMSKAYLTSFHEPMLVLFMSCGIYFVLNNLDMSFTHLIFLAIIFQRTVAQIAAVQSSYQSLAGSESFFKSINNLIDDINTFQEPDYSGQNPTFNDKIEFNNVSFSYPGSEVIIDSNIEIPVGNIVLFTGPSGIGKTTTVDLIAGLYKPLSGEIILDGTPLDKIDIHLWRSMIGYVSQETILFNDTVRTNITLGDSNISDEKVIKALVQADAWTFVEKLPDGLDTNVGERGNMLSGGQRQRIMIARALVNKPQLLIMDEPTSALDVKSTALLCEMLEHLKCSMTIIIITHQQSLESIADIVFEIKDKKIQQKCTDSVAVI